MSYSFFNLEQNELESIFPFYIEVDHSLTISHVGKSLKKLFPLIEGKKLTEVFKFNKPNIEDIHFEAIASFINQDVVLESLEDKSLFKEQIIILKKEKRLFFLGTPYTRDIESIEKMGLNMADFAFHDKTPDMLHVMRSHKLMMLDVAGRLKKVNQQKEEIEKKERLNSIQFLISKVLANANDFEVAIREIIKIICELLDWKCGIFWMSSNFEFLRRKEKSDAATENVFSLKCFSYWQNEKIAQTDFEKWILSQKYTINETLIEKVIKENRSCSEKMLYSADIIGDFQELTTIKNLDYHIVFPVGNNGVLLGVLEFFSNQIEKSDEDLVNSLVVINDQIHQFILKKQSDWVIKENERRYRQIVEQASDIIYRMSDDGIIEFMNPIAYRLFKGVETDFIGQHFSILIHKDFQKSVMKHFRDQLINNRKVSYVEFIAKSIDHDEFWMGLKSTLIFENGKVAGFQMVGRDVTERKQHEDQLIKEKEIAENAKIVKEQFLANMSHEIRTPMNAIIGMTELLTNTTLNVEQKDCFNAIKISAENLLSIINDILDFSKIESGKIVFENAPFNLKETVEGVLKIFTYSTKKEVELLAKIDENLPIGLMGDSHRLRQVLINLMSNSIKFTEKGRIEINVHLLEKRDDNYKIGFKVIDTGIGIPKEKTDQIFESFTQATNETTRKYGGTGLGLTIVKQLVELQGGTVFVESEEGVGTCFTIILTMKKTEEEKNEKSENTKNGLDEFSELKNLKVLLAEDNSMNQLLAKKVFKKWECILDIADNGKIAIEKLINNEYDIVLMDMQMPVMDGYDATVFIRNNLAVPKSNIPIIALTAHALEGEKNKCLSLGMNDFVTKPFNQKDLYDKIKKITNYIFTN
ncbi:MAG: response regulator [Flavobacteriia bacterium]|nr:response regulator [Flavobacteriia bacterium]